MLMLLYVFEASQIRKKFNMSSNKQKIRALERYFLADFYSSNNYDMILIENCFIQNNLLSDT